MYIVQSFPFTTCVQYIQCVYYPFPLLLLRRKVTRLLCDEMHFDNFPYPSRSCTVLSRIKKGHKNSGSEKFRTCHSKNVIIIKQKESLSGPKVYPKSHGARTDGKQAKQTWERDVDENCVPRARCGMILRRCSSSCSWPYSRPVSSNCGEWKECLVQRLVKWSACVVRPTWCRRCRGSTAL